MIEVAVSMVIVSVILLTAMNMVGAAGQSTRSMTDRGTGNLLAEQLMAEILAQAYEEPDEPPGSFGTDGFEDVTKDRSYYDDVDDYDRWNAMPPEYKDGTAVPGYAQWRRRVDVDWVQPADTRLIAAGNTGIKRILVTVTRNAVKVAEFRALRTDTGDDE
jgi:Tfp pilus assembly protein PilV